MNEREAVHSPAAGRSKQDDGREGREREAASPRRILAFLLPPAAAAAASGRIQDWVEWGGGRTEEEEEETGKGVTRTSFFLFFFFFSFSTMWGGGVNMAVRESQIPPSRFPRYGPHARNACLFFLRSSVVRNGG